MHDIKKLQTLALRVIEDIPGLTRMEWFRACNQKRNFPGKINWHTFKFQVVLKLVVDNQVKVDGDFFFHNSHTI